MFIFRCLWLHISLCKRRAMCWKFYRWLRDEWRQRYDGSPRPDERMSKDGEGEKGRRDRKRDYRGMKVRQEKKMWKRQRGRKRFSPHFQSGGSGTQSALRQERINYTSCYCLFSLPFSLFFQIKRKDTKKAACVWKRYRNNLHSTITSAASRRKANTHTHSFTSCVEPDLSELLSAMLKA